MDYPLVFKKFHIWRLFTNFCFLGGFSFPFVIRVLMMCVRHQPLALRPTQHFAVYFYTAQKTERFLPELVFPTLPACIRVTTLGAGRKPGA